jgi:hypothetical protein
MSQRPYVRALAIGAAGLTAAFTAPAAFAATAPAHAVVHVNAAMAGASHGLRAASVESSNWSGYAATGATGAFTSVSASWTQPTLTCTSKTTYSSYWVGLDGYSNSALEQTGTEADCIGGKAEYGAWWEVLPAAESPYSVTVKAGDALSASVVDNGNGTFTMTLTDSTEGWSKATTATGSSGYQDSSAEVIAEATDVNGRIANLSDFGTASFTNATADGNSLSSYSPTEIVMAGSRDTKAQPSAISGGSFSVTWEHYS